jgi:hypothetical protein
MIVDPQLYSMALLAVSRQKQAFVPTQDPSAGMMPPGGDPAAAAGGAPPVADPAAMQQPGMDPAAMQQGGVAPTDQAAMQQGAPPPAAPGMMPAAPQAAPQQQAAGGKPKFDPLALDYRMYNLQQLVTAIATSLGVTIPPGALIMPPGSAGAPPSEAALPGGPGDPGAQQQQQPQGGIQPMQSAGAAPQTAAPIKTAAMLATEEREFQALLADISGESAELWHDETKTASVDIFQFPEPVPVVPAAPPAGIDTISKNAATLAALFRANAMKAGQR